MTQQCMQTDQIASNGRYTAEFDRPNSIENGQISSGHTFTVFKWNASDGYEIQEYWEINGLGHAWSGGDQSIDLY